MRKTTMKKLLSLALVTVMCMGMTTGCGSQGQKNESSSATSTATSKSAETSQSVAETTAQQEELEPVTLKWYLSATEQEGSADVEEAFNAKLAEVLPNTTVEFTYVESYGTNWPLLISGGEKMDLAWGGYATPFFQDALDGNLMPLDDLIEQYAPNLQKEMEIWPGSYATAIYEDVLYGVPCIQPIASETQRINVGKDFYEFIDMDALLKELRSSKKLTSNFLDIVEAGIEKAIASGGAFALGADTWNCMHDLNWAAMGYMLIGPAGNKMWFDPEAEHPEVMHLWEIPEVEMLLERYAEWYDRGWYYDSLMLGQVTASSQATVQFFNGWSNNWANSDENGINFIEQPTASTTLPYYEVMTNLPSEGYVGPLNFGGESSYVVIPYTAENPERAMMLLNVLHDEEGTVGNELFNMISYGFEQNSDEAKKYGWFNYTLTEKDGAPYADKSTRGEAPSKHSLYNWMMGNTYYAISDGTASISPASKTYSMNYYEETYPNLKRTAIADMVADYSSLANEVGSVKAVVTEYEKQLNFGGGGTKAVKALYEETMKKINDAGLDKIKAEIQKQIDAYIASK